MLTYVLRRMIAGLIVIFFASLIVFSMLYIIPGDPIDILVLSQIGITQEQRVELREKLGLDQPFLKRYVDYCSNLLLHGDWGNSLVYGRYVKELILQQLPATFQLTIAAILFAIPLGILFGIISAVNRDSWIDTSSMFISVIGVSVPQFWMGLILILVFSIKLGLFPPMGSIGVNTLILPAITLGFRPLALIARISRSSMLEVLNLDYITTARGKGLTEKRVIFYHALRNAFIPILTVIGIQIGTLLSQAMIIEIVFARQGIGKLLVDSIIAKDFPVVQGIILLIAIIYIIINIFIDILYHLIDPTVQIEG
ncbi:Glutathione transport system permease protein GsiC [subsurface metagenome]